MIGLTGYVKHSVTSDTTLGENICAKGFTEQAPGLMIGLLGYV